MIKKTLFAAALGLAVMTGGSSMARADVDISINLGFGGFYGKNISCRTGARIVAQRFNRVAIDNCRGSNYDYIGRRNGKWFLVKVNAYSGRIVDVRRIRR